MMTELPTIAKAAELIRLRVLRPLELVEHCLARIEQFEPRVRAWVAVDAAGARREALRLETLLEQGSPLSPLHGIPLGIKDIIDVAGWPTKCGSSLRETHIAERDATVVARLRRAGAIILGKTVTTQFACFDPAITRNPWNMQHTPGGSSSGSAAAVALEMCVAAIGTQTGGSIIRPASFCGISGFKPSYGAIDMRGIVPLSHHLDHVGPLGRSVGDLHAIWKCLADRVPESTVEFLQVGHLEQEFEQWLDSYALTLALRVAQSPLLERTEPDVRSTTEAALGRLQSSLQLLPLTLPASLLEVPAQHRRIMAVEAAAHHRAAFAQNSSAFEPHITALIEEGLATSAVDYADALQHQRRFRQEMAECLTSSGAEPLSCFVMPATVTAAPGLDTTGDPTFNSPWSYAGLPAITIPCGLTPRGMPCGMQFVGAVAGQVFALAGLAERVLQLRQRPPLLEEKL
jgi:aspartyl-tRNA(Asn)/glutamyl-tRNA(Gln) amidotransferase subunit A